jgi:nucleoside-diphosphate-sugar epimerase
MWLIIGGSGFIGVNFSKFLIENDYNFKIYDLKKSKYLPKKVETILGDIRDKKKLSNAMCDCDTVFHLATIPPSMRFPPDEIYDIDVNGSRNVIKIAKNNNIKRLVFTSSASHVYGMINNNTCPIEEDCNLNPINEYGKNKVIIEELCKKASDNRLKTIILRLSMVLGPYNSDPILLENISSFLKNKSVIIAGDGNVKAQSIHVNDVNTALAECGKIFDKYIPKNLILNISGEEVFFLKDFIKQSKFITNSKSRVIHLPFLLTKSLASIAWWAGRTNIHPSYLNLMKQDQYFDISKAKKILNWEPKYSTTQALQDTVDFIKRENQISKY